MPHSPDLWLYFVLVLGVIALPGMDMAYVATNALVGGWRAGFTAVAGIVAGGVVHVAVAATGIAVVLSLWPPAFDAMLVAGAQRLGPVNAYPGDSCVPGVGRKVRSPCAARPFGRPPESQRMNLSDFPITRKWPAQHPERIQLYSLNTPNGVKASIALEETGLPYEAHRVDLGTNDQLSPEFLSLNPNNKIPALIDPLGPEGRPLPLWESGAILLYIADKAGQLMPATPNARWETVQWLMFQMGGIGPMFGQVGFFHKFAGKDYEDKRPRERYANESRRLLAVLEQRLQGREWIMGDEYTIADIATFPWVNNLVGFYGAAELVKFDEFSNVQRVLRAFLARPAVQRGMDSPKRPA
jgi:GST-like protein